MKTLLLKFAGPLQAWGTDSHFETRQTDLHPSKSAVIGILAASFGYRRDEDEKINKLNELKFAVRIDQQGRLLRDYHIAQKFKTDGKFERTYVTNRYYLEDAIFIVALSHDDNQFIDDIYSNIRNPYFQSFMGRRSCPLLADFIVGSYDMDIINCLKNHPWEAKDWYKKNHSNTVSLYMDADINPSLIYSPRRDNVISFSQKERKHQYRNEAQTMIKLVDPDQQKDNAKCFKEHDAISGIEEV